MSEQTALSFDVDFLKCGAGIINEKCYRHTTLRVVQLPSAKATTIRAGVHNLESAMENLRLGSPQKR